MNTRMLAPLIAAVALGAAPAFANHPTGKIVVNTAPPNPASEDTPAQREDQVWAPGYWGWTGSKFEWNKGHYVQARKGYRYTAPRWVQENNSWTLYPEQWVTDEDDKDKLAKDSSMPKPR